MSELEGPASAGAGSVTPWMHLDHVELTDFRSHASLSLDLAPGVTVVVGPNGSGKTNLVEAVGWLATQRSFRGAPTEALIRAGAERAIVRAEVTSGERRVLLEAEIGGAGRNRVQVNRQRLARTSDLIGVFQTTVFTPDALALVKEGPAVRRDFCDEIVASLHARHGRLQSELDKVLRQRNALLKSAQGRLDAEAAFTLDVWDAKLVESGAAVAHQRAHLAEVLEPMVNEAYRALAGGGARIELEHVPGWSGALDEAVAAARDDDVRRGVTTVGPHRDELAVGLAGMPVRTHASQGEQRSVALALRLAGHRLVTDRVGAAPVLVLDDVFSELDPSRSDALLGTLPPGQVLVTTAGVLPPSLDPDDVVDITRCG